MKRTLKGIFKLALPITAFGILLGSNVGVTAGELVCVNGDKLFELSTAAKQLKSEMEQKRNEIIKDYQTKFQEIQKKLQTLQQELQSGLLTDEAKKQKQKEFIKLQQELQKLQIQAQMELQKFAEQQLKKLDKLVKSSLKALAKTEGFKAVTDCQRLIYYEPDIDITPKVAKVIDQIAKAPKGKE